MHANQVGERMSWDEGTLAQEITERRGRKELEELEQFLLERLEDKDSHCVSVRPGLWNELGLAMLRNDNVGRAEECFNNALALDPDNQTALYNLGTLLMQQGDLSGALIKYAIILDRKSDNFNALFNSGLCHLYKEEKESASSFFIKAADLKKNDGQAQYLAGEMLLQLGEAERALPYFRAASRENPGHFETCLGLAISLLKTGNYGEAITVCDTALMEFGLATLPLQIKGDAALALGRVEDAVRCHGDLCRLDLDIRDFVVTRLQTLASEDPTAFAAYAAKVHASFPELAEIVRSVQKQDRAG